MDWALVIGGMLIALLVIYALTGGADFGGGFWDLMARGPRAERQRQLIDRAIGPVWEANHVWLIAMIVVLFIAFPKAFALFSTALHIPLTLLLFGVIARGSAFVFRHYDTAGRHGRWSRIFAVSSTIAPVMLGVCLGSLSSGHMQLTADGSPATAFVSPWLQPLPWLVGLFALALVAFLAALYLTREADDEELRDDFRRRALGSLVAAMVLGAVAYLVARTEAPYVAAGLTERGPWGPALFVTGLLAGGITLAALIRTHLALARIAGVVTVCAVLLGWAAAMYPYLIWPTYTAIEAAAPTNILKLTFWIFAIGGVLLVPSMIMLFAIFKWAPNQDKR